MKKLVLAVAAICLLAVGDKATSQTGEFRCIILQGVADQLVDSTLTLTAMNDKRCYINGIYAWYDNGINTNTITIDVARGGSQYITGVGRVFKYAEAMTSGGFKSFTFTPNVTSGADSTLYFSINATGSDSLFLAVNYKLVGK